MKVAILSDLKSKQGAANGTLYNVFLLLKDTEKSRMPKEELIQMETCHSQRVFPSKTLLHFFPFTDFQNLFASVFRELFVSQMPSSKSSFFLIFFPFIQIYRPTVTCFAFGPGADTEAPHISVCFSYSQSLQLGWAIWPLLANGLSTEVTIKLACLLHLFLSLLQQPWGSCFPDVDSRRKEVQDNRQLLNPHQTVIQAKNKFLLYLSHWDFRASLLHKLAIVNLTKTALWQSRFKCPNGLGKGYCVSCQYFAYQVREPQGQPGGAVVKFTRSTFAPSVRQFGSQVWTWHCLASPAVAGIPHIEKSGGRWAWMLAQGQSSSAKRGGLAADVSSGLIFLKNKKKKIENHSCFMDHLNSLLNCFQEIVFIMWLFHSGHNDLWCSWGCLSSNCGHLC